jgi:hypothetical protein
VRTRFAFGYYSFAPGTPTYQSTELEDNDNSGLKKFGTSLSTLLILALLVGLVLKRRSSARQREQFQKIVRRAEQMEEDEEEGKFVIDVNKLHRMN